MSSILNNNFLVNLSTQQKEQLIREAQQCAEEGGATGNSPFGALIVDEQGTIMLRAHHKANPLDPVTHAEVNAIRTALVQFNTKDLNKYILVSNAASCPMCMSIALKVNIQNFIFGAPNESHMNPFITPQDIVKKSRHPLYIEQGILEQNCIKQIARWREAVTKKI